MTGDFPDVIAALAATAEGVTAPVSPRQPGDSPGFLLWRVSLRWQRLMTAALKPLALTHVQFVVLASAPWLGSATGAPPTQQQLADPAAIDPMTTSQVLRTLERRALLVRRPDPGDARARRVEVTETGAELAQRSIEHIESADAEFFTGTLRRPLLAALRHLAARSTADQRRPEPFRVVDG